MSHRLALSAAKHIRKKHPIAPRSPPFPDPLPPPHPPPSTYHLWPYGVILTVTGYPECILTPHLQPSYAPHGAQVLNQSMVEYYLSHKRTIMALTFGAAMLVRATARVPVTRVMCHTHPRLMPPRQVTQVTHSPGTPGPRLQSRQQQTAAAVPQHQAG